MAEFASEQERRREALRLAAEEPVTLAEAARRVGRSRQWLSKWKRRAETGEGLIDRSRAPLTSPTALPNELVGQVLGYRDRLEADPVASIGSTSIVAAMERDGVEPLPAERSIERILARHGRSRPPAKKRSRSTVPVLPLPDVGHTPGVWQQADWVQDRYLTGGIRFNSIQLLDMGSQGLATRQYLHRTVLHAVELLLEAAWPQLSIPHGLSVDNAFAKTTHPNNPWTLVVRTCLFFGVEVIVSPPSELGWTNGAENANNLWQNRTIARHRYHTLEDLQAHSGLFEHWANYLRPILDPAICDTRYPAVLIDKHRHQLRWPPDITITDHLDPTGTLRIPLTRGRITFLRRVHTGVITLAHTKWTVDLPDHSLVVASITTGDATLTIRHQATIITTHPYPLRHPIKDPYYQPQPNSLYHHA